MDNENSKSIEWYESQVSELKDIRKIFYEICGDTVNGKDAYFPDLIKKELNKLKAQLLQANLDLVRAGKNQERWEIKEQEFMDEIEELENRSCN